MIESLPRDIRDLKMAYFLCVQISGNLIQSPGTIVLALKIFDKLEFKIVTDPILFYDCHTIHGQSFQGEPNEYREAPHQF